MKLLNRINEKIEVNISVDPLEFFVKILNSLWIELIIVFHRKEYREGIIHNAGGIIKKIISLLIQFTE